MYLRACVHVCNCVRVRVRVHVCACACACVRVHLRAQARAGVICVSVCARARVSAHHVGDVAEDVYLARFQPDDLLLSPNSLIYLPPPPHFRYKK